MGDNDETTDTSKYDNKTTKREEHGVSKPNWKQGKFQKNLLSYIRNYTEYTGIHGLKYTVEKGRSISERSIWIIMFIISLWASVLLIKNTWTKWDTTPVIVSFGKEATSIWKIPFPAVTVCPQTKSKISLYNFTDDYYKWQDGELDSEGISKMTASSLVCNNEIFTKGDKMVDSDAVNHIITVAPSLDGILFKCVWAFKYINCSSLFTETITEDGLCFTFNMLRLEEIFRSNVYTHGLEDRQSESEWSLEDGYSKTAKTDAHPKRVMYDGFPGSLVLLLTDFRQDFNYVCRNEGQGYKIIFHNPAEYPQSSVKYYQAPLNEELLIKITPDMMKTSESIMKYEPQKRECFFANEGYLSLFRSYTQENCEIECLANLTLAKCGCVAFYMPHEESTPVCGPGSSQCIVDARAQLIEEEVEIGISEKKKSKRAEFDTSKCNCLPGCTSLLYNAEFSQSDLNWKKVEEGYRENFDAEMPGVVMTRVTMFFKQAQFITSERNELFGMADFLAHCGGILGLLTGFSLLSLVEIIYFLSLRLFCNVKMYGTRYWAGYTSTTNKKMLQ